MDKVTADALSIDPERVADEAERAAQRNLHSFGQRCEIGFPVE